MRIDDGRTGGNKCIYRYDIIGLSLGDKQTAGRKQAKQQEEEEGIKNLNTGGFLYGCYMYMYMFM